MNICRATLSIGALAVSLVLLEVAVRSSGMVDFPLYVANSEIGYIPAPSQSGIFLRKNRWQFNSKSMGGADFSPSAATDTLLLGDSVVQGGNPVDERDRLGPQLQAALQNPVWPISAGSWSLRNELKYLKLHPDVLDASDQIIFVLNNEDFGEASSWSCETTHPRTHPLWATMFAFRKYVWDWETCGQVPDNLLVSDGNWIDELRGLLSSELVQGKTIVFVLYPDKEETEKSKPLTNLEVNSPAILSAGHSASVGISVVSVARDNRWKPSYYRDDIHPTVEGTRVLSEIISAPSDNAKLARSLQDIF